MPIASLCGRPWLARRMRASCTLDSGTETAPEGLKLVFDARGRERVHDLAALALG